LILNIWYLVSIILHVVMFVTNGKYMINFSFPKPIGRVLTPTPTLGYATAVATFAMSRCRLYDRYAVLH